MATPIPLLRRREIIAALRNGTVPQFGFDQLAVGIDRFETAVDEELDRAAIGQGVFKAVRGEWGAGKTFFARWLQHRAQHQGFATAEVQISETETPLYRLETVYRRALEHLRTREWHDGAFKSLIDRWFFALEEEVLARPDAPADEAAIAAAVGELLEARLAKVSATQPQFAAALRRIYRARLESDPQLADGLLAWLMGDPHVAAAVKRQAGIKGEVDHFAATGFLRGLLSVLTQTGRKGLVLVLDEVETIQRMRSDVRERSLNALRQLLDDVDAGRYPGLYVLVTGTPAFFEGPQGARALPPLAQRLHVDFAADMRFDSTRAVQVRLAPFDEAKLVEVGRKVRDLYPTREPDRLALRLPDEVLTSLAQKTAGKLGGKVGLAPRLFLKKLVGDVLDRIEEHPDFDPAVHYELAVTATELTDVERQAAGIVRGVDDIELDLVVPGDEP
jgi:hypothetical protein